VRTEPVKVIQTPPERLYIVAGYDTMGNKVKIPLTYMDLAAEDPRSSRRTLTVTSP